MQLSSDTPTVLFSIETMTRELDSKLVMASVLAARGLRTIVAHKEAAWEIGRTSQRLVWQGKNLFADSSDDHHADHLIANGSPIMFLQDEGAIFQVNGWVHTVLQKHHVDLVRKRRIDRVCMWGERQRDVFAARAPEANSAVVVTGSPRFDLSLPKFGWMTRDAGAEIRARYGSYILACTRFTAIAHAEGLHDPFRRKLNPRIWPDDYDIRTVAGLWFSKWQRDVHDFADFVVLVKAIADAHPQRTIVLRPHPSESLSFYQQAFAAIGNVAVIREGSALNWIRGADLVVHSNCTTGIEAVLAGRPTLNFLPASAGRKGTDIEVAREAGLTAGTLEEALVTVDQLLSGDALAHVWSDDARDILNNLKADSIPLLVDETLSLLREAKIDSSRISLPREKFVRNAVKRLLGRPETTAYVAAKRGPFDPHQIEAVVAGCHASQIGGGRVSHMTRHYVVIDPA